MCWRVCDISFLRQSVAGDGARLSLKPWWERRPATRRGSAGRVESDRGLALRSRLQSLFSLRECWWLLSLRQRARGFVRCSAAAAGAAAEYINLDRDAEAGVAGNCRWTAVLVAGCTWSWCMPVAGRYQHIGRFPPIRAAALVPNLGVNYASWVMGPFDLCNGLVFLY